jgi:AAA domain/DnaB-like helicase N terminal domain
VVLVTAAEMTEALTTPIAASVTAEQSALGSILSAGDAANELARSVFEVATPEMFWRPSHEVLGRVIAAMVDADIAVDPQTVMARLRDSGELSKVGGAGYLHVLMERAWTVQNAVRYAREVRECYRRRQIREAGLRVVQQAASPEIDLELLVFELAAAADKAVELAGDGAPILPATLADLLSFDPTPDWLIPGLLERRERVMVTGFEGLGKSVLLAQIALCLNAGVHPFTGQPGGEKLRVLVVDVENPRSLLTRRYGWIAEIVHGISPVDPTALMIEVHEEGVDLTDPDKIGWLDRMLTAARPDVLMIGPLYKLHRSNLNDETAARSLAHTFDTLRMRHNLALIIEAHSGQAEDTAGRRKLRPRGSSLFLGWPNVGIGIRPHKECQTDPPNWVEMKAWRGHREDREWPTELSRGSWGQLPWVATADYLREAEKAS